MTLSEIQKMSSAFKNHHVRDGPRLGSNVVLSAASCVTSSDLTSCGRKVRVLRGVRGRPTLKEFAGRTGSEKEGSPKNTSSNAPGDGFAPLSQGLGSTLTRLVPSVRLVDLDLDIVKGSPCLASWSGRSRRSTRGGGRPKRAFLTSPLGIWGRGFDGAGRLAGAVPSKEGCGRCWEGRGAGLGLSRGESIDWIMDNFLSDRQKSRQPERMGRTHTPAAAWVITRWQEIPIFNVTDVCASPSATAALEVEENKK